MSKYAQLPLPKMLKLAQQDFNAYIRERDRDKGCISCSTGAVEHAGHYFSQGHHSLLRYNELNVNGQCERCNTFLRGNLIHYRNGLIKRYGEAKVLLLESCERRSAKKWARHELVIIRDHFKKKTLELKQ